MRNILQEISQIALPTAIMWLVGFSGIGCQSGDSCGAVQQEMGSASFARTEVPVFAKVSEGLYRGGQPSKQGFAKLRKMGIRTVVSLRLFNTSRKILSGMRFRQFHISCKTLHPEEEDVIEFLRIATDPANQPVFVHCRDGTDRTGMMVAMYRMVVQDWSRSEALEEMRAFGFNEIWDPLEDYVKEVDTKKIKSKLAYLRSVSNEGQ